MVQLRAQASRRLIDPIWKTALPSIKTIKKVERLSEKQRQTIFAESVGCEDDATKKADAKPGTTTPGKAHSANEWNTLRSWERPSVATREHRTLRARDF